MIALLWFLQGLVIWYSVNLAIGSYFNAAENKTRTAYLQRAASLILMVVSVFSLYWLGKV